MNFKKSLFYVLVRNTRTKQVDVASYYSGLSIFAYSLLAKRRVRSLKRKMAKTHEFRILPWHTEMGEIDLREMWRSSLEINTV